MIKKRVKNMRFLLCIAALVASLSLSGLAQSSSSKPVGASGQKKVRAKHERSDADLKSSGKGGGGALPKGSARAGDSKSLKTLEQQTSKSAAGSKASSSKGRTGALLKAQKEKSNPPIKFGGGGKGSTGGGKTGNPYRGRLRQKGSHR